MTKSWSCSSACIQSSLFASTSKRVARLHPCVWSIQITPVQGAVHTVLVCSSECEQSHWNQSACLSHAQGKAQGSLAITMSPSRNRLFLIPIVAAFSAIQRRRSSFTRFHRLKSSEPNADTPVCTRWVPVSKRIHGHPSLRKNPSDSLSQQITTKDHGTLTFIFNQFSKFKV